MAAKLECEVCGGKLIGKPGGIFECESCGMEYSTEWARQKIQEIKGTVKVEGTVQVTGKVQVEGGTVNVEGAATKESLLKRAKMCCAEKDWNKAKELLEQVLNADPECGEAYLYRYLAGQKQPTPETLVAACTSYFVNFPTAPDLEKAEKFADEKLIGLLNRCKQECADAVEADKKHRQACVGALAERRKALEPVRKFIACDSCTVGLRVDGTVVTTDYDKVDAWQDVVAIAYDGCTVGLRADGTVVTTGDDKVDAWRDVVAIARGCGHTVGLHADGTVVAVGENLRGQCNVGDWRNVISIACGSKHTVGLRADGTVVSTLLKETVSSWRDVVAIACTEYDIFGLRADGTVVATGLDPHRQRDVGAWRDVIAIACSNSHTVGLRADGTVVAAGYNSHGQCDVGTWRDVVAIACGSDHTVGLCADGTVVAAGDDQCDVSGWKLFNSMETLDQELAEAQERRKREAEKRCEAHKAALAQECAALQAELSGLKGLFTGKRRRELEARLAAIEAEQESLHSDECSDPAGLL